MTLSLRSRLTVVYTLVFGALIITMAVVSYRVLAYQLDADTRATLAERTSGIHGYLRFGDALPTVEFDPTDPAEAAYVNEVTRYYQIFDAASGELIAQSDTLKPLGVDFTPAEVRELRGHPRTLDVETDYGRLRLSNSVITAAGGREYLLQVGVSLAGIDRTLQRFLVLLLFGVPASFAVAAIVGRWMAGFALTPLGRLADETRHIDIQDLGRRVPMRGAGDELDEVAAAFNATLARLEHAVGEMRQFSAALAHELRTPLAALRGDIELELVRPDTTDDSSRRLVSQLEEIDKLKRLIDQILMLARAEAGEIRLKVEPVDLRDLASRLVDQLEPVAGAKGLTLECVHADTAVVSGDAEWLKRVILNLLDNAIKFTPAGGRVTVGVSRNPGEATLTIRDTGVGIDPAAQSRLFERFFRADPARSPGVDGAGLGLSLAKWIVDRHHGRIEVESQPGRGSVFSVHLPLAADRARTHIGSTTLH